MGRTKTNLEYLSCNFLLSTKILPKDYLFESWLWDSIHFVDWTVGKVREDLGRIWFQAALLLWIMVTVWIRWPQPWESGHSRLLKAGDEICLRFVNQLTKRQMWFLVLWNRWIKFYSVTSSRHSLVAGEINVYECSLLKINASLCRSIFCFSKAKMKSSHSDMFGQVLSPLGSAVPVNWIEREVLCWDFGICCTIWGTFTCSLSSWCAQAWLETFVACFIEKLQLPLFLVCCWREKSSSELELNTSVGHQ